MLVVIRIGGSVIGSPTNSTIIDQYTKLLRKLKETSCKIIAVVGGGALAREFIMAGNQLGVSEEAQDWLAINVSRLHALLFTLRLGKDGTETVPASVEEAIEALKKGKIVVMGGLEPGMTTDTVAAYVAQKTGARLIVKATDQDGIYNKDPKKHKDARKLDKLSYGDLIRLLEQNCHKAGIHQILDPVAVRILQETNVKTIVVNGNAPKNVKLAVEGKKIGTTIKG